MVRLPGQIARNTCGHGTGLFRSSTRARAKMGRSVAQKRTKFRGHERAGWPSPSRRPPTIWRGRRSPWRPSRECSANCRRIGGAGRSPTLVFGSRPSRPRGLATPTITAQGGKTAFGVLDTGLQVAYARLHRVDAKKTIRSKAKDCRPPRRPDNRDQVRL